MLRRQIDKILLNSDPGVAFAGTILTVPGHGEIDKNDLIAALKTVSASEVARVQDVTVVIPTSCECPYEWTMEVHCLPDTTTYETQTTFESRRVYSYIDPSGAVPNENVVAQAIIDDINGDEFSCVTAQAGGAGLPEIELTSKAGRDFRVYSPSATIATALPLFSRAVLEEDQVRRVFPIKHGSFGSKPELPVAGGTYTVFHLTGEFKGQEEAGASHYHEVQHELKFYIEEGQTALIALFDNLL